MSPMPMNDVTPLLRNTSPWYQRKFARPSHKPGTVNFPSAFTTCAPAGAGRPFRPTSRRRPPLPAADENATAFDHQLRIADRRAATAIDERASVYDEDS